ncbi:phosphopantetheine-binding protein [Paracidovorax anthurii]|uniref:phosphopantetheine-binding protein n=1 Tax=Paracidovorax anthurii TaxID=78229 RepID=UPI0039F09F33
MDRKALPAPGAGAQRVFEAARGETELAIARIWAEVLGLDADRIGRRDHFFECGGDSLALLSVQAQVHQRLGLQLPLRAYFENPTLAAVAALVDSHRESAARDEASDVLRMAALLDALEA